MPQFQYSQPRTQGSHCCISKIFSPDAKQQKKKELWLIVCLLSISGNKESTVTVPHSRILRTRLMRLFHETRRTHREQPLPAHRRSKEAPGTWLNFPISSSFSRTQYLTRMSTFTSIALPYTRMRSGKGMCRNQNSGRRRLSGA